MKRLAHKIYWISHFGVTAYYFAINNDVITKLVYDDSDRQNATHNIDKKISEYFCDAISSDPTTVLELIAL